MVKGRAAKILIIEPEPPNPRLLYVWVRFVEEIIKKSKNPVIAIHPWLKAGCCDRGFEAVAKSAVLPFRTHLFSIPEPS